jgi:hypothetical protein
MDVARSRQWMIEGSLDIYWENNEDVAATPRYRLRFLLLRKIEMTLGPKPLVGKEALLDYLTTMQDLMMPLERRQQYAKEWLLQLDSRTSLSLPLVTFNESQLEEFPH